MVLALAPQLSGVSDGLVCSAGDDDGLACVSAAPQSSVSATLPVEAGATYFVIVGGVFSFDNPGLGLGLLTIGIE